MMEWLMIPITLLTLIFFGWMYSRIKKRLLWRYRRCLVLLRKYRRHARFRLSPKVETFVTKDGLVMIEDRRLRPPLISYFYRKERPSILWWQMAHHKLALEEVQDSESNLRLLLREQNGKLRHRDIPKRMRERLREGMLLTGLLNKTRLSQ